MKRNLKGLKPFSNHIQVAHDQVFEFGQNSHVMYYSPRLGYSSKQGLSLKSGKITQDSYCPIPRFDFFKERFWMSDYRYMILPQLIYQKDTTSVVEGLDPKMNYLDKILMALSMIKKEIPKDQIQHKLQLEKELKNRSFNDLYDEMKGEYLKYNKPIFSSLEDHSTPGFVQQNEHAESQQVDDQQEILDMREFYGRSMSEMKTDELAKAYGIHQKLQYM